MQKHLGQCRRVLSPVRLFATPWTVAPQAPLSMGFSRQEHWSGSHFLLQGIFPTQDWTHICAVSPALWADSLPLSHQGSPLRVNHRFKCFSRVDAPQECSKALSLCPHWNLPRKPHNCWDGSHSSFHRRQEFILYAENAYQIHDEMSYPLSTTDALTPGMDSVCSNATVRNGPGLNLAPRQLREFMY